ncbi:putative 11-oxo-beta-amyrin 30-oxidase [Helianthus anomalus]
MTLDLWGDGVNEFKLDIFYKCVLKGTNGQTTYDPSSCGHRIGILHCFACSKQKMLLVMILQHFCYELLPNYSNGS